MRQLTIFTFFIIVSITCVAQEMDVGSPLPDKYSLVNNFVRSRRIKYVIDSSEYYNPGKCRIFIYDTLGRLLGDINYPIEKFDNPYVYRKVGDTTYRSFYYKDTLKYYERFVHNNKGQIVNYLSCRNYLLNPNSYCVYFDAFYYDENNKLQSKLSYYDENFPGKVADNAIIKPTGLKLLDVINYSYKTLANGNKLIIGKHTFGNDYMRATDSSTYDRQNRIIRSSSFSKKGGGGCAAYYNTNGITLYEYSGAKVKITCYSTYCRGVDLQTGTCLLPEQSAKDVKYVIYNSNRTPKENMIIT